MDRPESTEKISTGRRASTGPVPGRPSVTKQGTANYLRKQVVLDEEIARAASRSVPHATGRALKVLTHDLCSDVRLAAADSFDEALVLTGTELAHFRCDLPRLLKRHMDGPTERLDEHHHGRVVRRLRDPGVKLQRVIH